MKKTKKYFIIIILLFFVCCQDEEKSSVMENTNKTNVRVNLSYDDVYDESYNMVISEDNENTDEIGVPVNKRINSKRTNPRKINYKEKRKKTTIQYENCRRGDCVDERAEHIYDILYGKGAYQKLMESKIVNDPKRALSSISEGQTLIITSEFTKSAVKTTGVEDEISVSSLLEDNHSNRNIKFPKIDAEILKINKELKQVTNTLIKIEHKKQKK